MTRLDLDLSDDLRDALAEAAAAAGYGSVTEFAEYLLRREVEIRRLEARLLSSVDSGETTEVTPTMFEEIKARLASRRRSSTISIPDWAIASSMACKRRLPASRQCRMRDH